MIAVLLAAALLAAPAPRTAAPARVTMVVCAPGFPGTTTEAQPSMDALSGVIARLAGWSAEALGAVYHQDEKAGLARLAQPDAAVAFVPAPFFVKHRDTLKLTPRMQVVMKGAGESEVWTLVAKKGRITKPAALDGFTLLSTAGYAPAFVRAALGGWGALPAGATIAQSNQILSALRKAAAGERVAVLLDSASAASLPTLPFAADLEVVAKSAPLPAGFVCTIDKRLPEGRWKALEAALGKVASDAQGAPVLDGIRMTRFVPASKATVDAARRLGSEPAK